MSTPWLEADELRVGLGCMRLSTDPDRDEERALQTMLAALDAGVSVFDTARAYALSDEDMGHNERLLAQAVRARPGVRARVVTKGGMRRPGGAWRPQGQARSVRADCEASLEALGGLPIDLYLLHAPDPRTAWATSVRALAALLDAGLVRRVGVSNINRLQLDQALDLAPLAAIEVALSPLEDKAVQGGVLARAIERGLSVLAHAPLGGPKRVAKLRHDEVLRGVGDAHRVGPAEVALALLLDIHPAVIPIPGARDPAAARACATAARLTLDDRERQRLRARFPSLLQAAPARAAAVGLDAPEVVLVMGLQGSGKTDSVALWEDRGYERLNRDQRGGTLRELHRLLDERLEAGVRRLVLDNTYVTRAARRQAIEAAQRHGARIHGVWRETPLAQAQVNAVLRMLAHHRRLLEPAELRAGRDPAALSPTAQFRTLRELEPPDLDEGFSELETVPFARRGTNASGGPALLVSLDAVESDGVEEQLRGEPRAHPLVFGWRPETKDSAAALEDRLRARTGAALTVALCTHPGGPPQCWCRPPLPGLALAFAFERNIDWARSTVVGTSPAHAAMADALGARYQPAR